MSSFSENTPINPSSGSTKKVIINEEPSVFIEPSTPEVKPVSVAPIQQESVAEEEVEDDREIIGAKPTVQEVTLVDPTKPSTTSKPHFLPQMGRILCCLCGTSIIPNEAAMCLPCLQKNTDISNLLELHTAHEVTQCRKCEKWYTGNHSNWISHDLESKGLLNLLLKRIPGLYAHDIKILDANWIWTESHSKRLKFYVHIQQMVMDGKMALQSKVTYEFVIKHKQCLDCIHEATDHTWGAMIQLRQALDLTTSGGHSNKQDETSKSQKGSKKHHQKRVFYHIESLITKHKLHNLISDIHVSKDGFDFYFKQRNQADRIVEFLSCNFPVKIKFSRKLVSEDRQSNSARYEQTIHMEILPVHKHDLVITAKQWLGGKSDIMLVSKLTSSIHLTHPSTLQHVEISVQKWLSSTGGGSGTGGTGGASSGGGGGGGHSGSGGSSLSAGCVLLHEKHLIPFIVLDITPINTFHQSNSKAKSIPTNVSSKKRGKGSKGSGKGYDGNSEAGSMAAGNVMDVDGGWVLAEAEVSA